MTPTGDFLQQAEEVIRHTLEKLRPQLLEAQGNIEHRVKGDETVVTEMDLLVEQRLRDALATLDQGISFSGEETGADFSQETFWLADPIDGTEAFIRGLPFATNMIALMHKGEAIMSVINNIALGEYFLAIKGKGATRNGHPIHVSDRPLDRAFLALSAKGHNPANKGLYDHLATRAQSVRRFAGGGYEYSMLACGAIEGRVSFNPGGHEWDFAPGALLVQEAGGHVANIGSTGAYDYRDFNHIAANPVIFDELMQFMNQFTAPKQ